MSSDTFQLKIITPSGAGITEEVTSVTLPTSEGQIGILPQHVRYSAVLGTGLLSYTKGTATTNNLVVSGGFCNFADNTLTILADTLDEPSKIDIDSVRSQKLEIERKLQTLDASDPSWQATSAKLLRFQAVEELAKH